jgi:NADH:ubiquinone oxidoreductase subunit E
MSKPDREVLRVTICVGSSCYVRGSDQFGAALASLIEQQGLQDRVELSGAFCMDQCSMGVSVRVGDGPCHVISAKNADIFLEQEILPAVRGGEK